MKPRTVAILLFDNVELLDFAGPYEVFSSVRAADGSRPLRVVTVGAAAGPVRCFNGLVVQIDYALADCPPVDILLIPGGNGTRAVARDAALVAWVQQVAAPAELVTSVCTGSFVLGAAGLLDGRPAATYWGSVEELRRRFPAIDVQEGVRYVDSGRIVTSAGVSAGIDMALYLVARLYGDDVAAATARDIEYDYWPAGAA